MPMKANVIFCEKVVNTSVNGEYKASVVAPLTELKPISIPSNYTFHVLCSITGINSEIENKIKLTFLDPIECVVFSTGDVCVPPADHKANTLQFALEMVNTELYYEGEYKFSVHVNGELIYETPLNVVNGGKND